MKGGGDYQRRAWGGGGFERDSSAGEQRVAVSHGPNKVQKEGQRMVIR